MWLARSHPPDAGDQTIRDDCMYWNDRLPSHQVCLEQCFDALLCVKADDVEVAEPMSDLSERFAELMARMARSDADLFRTLGEQNASMRQMVDDLTNAPDLGHRPPVAVALAAPSLLPRRRAPCPPSKPGSAASLMLRPG